ncbi:hypothetical protein [Pseudomonas mangiferae]|uniref:Uncharacterized protein n=1 Tax=Pseudomonas mangiferae TaxID=2593654 RepID=A0A553GZP4_9PSED|nr:hypothetical protein [Pseudomonas mangiferae]TRX74975.1 hypothetical protein FM069_10640 [Pseudomonas mangiferae]
MSFTDSGLAASMSTLLVENQVMSREQFASLLQEPSDLRVRLTLATRQLRAFDQYWQALGVWLELHGGDPRETRGTRVPGRADGQPQTLLERSLYDDAFLDVARTIGRPRFDPVRAVTNHLRFIANRR